MVRSLYGKIKNQSHTAKNIRSGEMVSRIFETYKNSVIPHGRNIYQTSSDMAMATI